MRGSKVIPFLVPHDTYTHTHTHIHFVTLLYLGSEELLFGLSDDTHVHTHTCTQITLSFSTSLRMKMGTTVVFDGFTGTKTLDNANMQIAGSSVSSVGAADSDLNPVAIWQQSGSLSAVLDRDTPDDYRVYSLHFELTNPTAEDDATKSTRLLRGAARIRVVASNICKQRTTMKNDEATCLFSEHGIYGARPGDAAPLVVLRGKMLTKKIGQSSAFAGCINTISVTLATSVPLTPECATILLSGFYPVTGSNAIQKVCVRACVTMLAVDT